LHHTGSLKPIRIGAGLFHENQPESFRHTRRKRMEVENKLKAMGLELTAAGVPPPYRCRVLKSEPFFW